MRIGASQSAQLWVRKVYDYKRPKNLLTEYLKE